MAAITRQPAKKRSWGGMHCFKMITIILLLGTIWSVLTLHLVLLPGLSENAVDSTLFSEAIANRLVSPPSPALKQEEEVLPKLSFPQSNEENFHNPSVDAKNKLYMYHHTPGTPDGTEGVVILDMLLGHAYAYHQGGIYGGSCGDGNDVLRGSETSLLEAIGLQDFLQFACPRDFESKARKRVVPGRSYVEDGTRAFTPEYLDLLRRFVKYPKKEKRKKKTNTIVVHIRRGGNSFTPCRKIQYYKGFEPYLPNKHYQVSAYLFCFSKMSSIDRYRELTIFPYGCYLLFAKPILHIIG